MAHSCPICDQQCYCGGDIDDSCLDGTDAQTYCTHCDEEDDDDDDFDDDDL